LSIGIIISFILVTTALVAIPAIPKSYAHAFILRSEPADGSSVNSPPSQVNVYFSDPLDIHYSTVQVLDSSGKQVDNKDVKNINGDESTLTVSLPSGLPDGVYTVSTKVLDATDGHVTTNAFSFGVGQAVVKPIGAASSSPQLQIPEAAARFPALVGQVMVVGAALASLWLWRPVSRINWLNQLLLPSRSKIDARLVKFMLVGAIILLASGVAMIVVQANSIGASIGDAILTKFGNIWIIRMVQCGILLGISFAMYNRMKKRKVPAGTTGKETYPLLPRAEVFALLIIGFAINATTTLISHGASTGQPLPVVLYFIHNVVASIWIGGVIYLAFVLVPVLKKEVSKPQSEQLNYAIASTLSIVIPRFSIIVVALLGTIIITGPFLLYTLEPNLDLTISSLYGKALIAKLIMAGGMAAIGGYNQRIVHREAKATVIAIAANGSSLPERNGGESRRGGGGGSNGFPTGRGTDPKSALAKFRRSTLIESGLGIGLLVAVAVLVNTGTPASEFQSVIQSAQAQQSNSPTLLPQSFSETRFADNSTRVVLQIDPYVPGNNNFTISFLDNNKNPIDMKSAQLRYTQVEKNIGPIIVDAKPVSKGVFTANAAFGLPGHWNLRIEGVQAKTNATNYVVSYNDLFVKPKPEQLSINIKEFKLPENSSQPLYAMYDSSRNAIWLSDESQFSGKIWEFNLNSSKFTPHKLPGVNLVTIMSMDSSNRIWYLDPISKYLGVYDPATDKNQVYKVNTNDTITSVAVDDQNNSVWVTGNEGNHIYRFDTKANTFAGQVSLPREGAQPITLTTDKSTGLVWVLDSGLGTIAKIDPANNYNVTEYSPPDNGLATPTAMLIDPDTQNIYIAEHEGHAITIFNPTLHTFDRIPIEQDNTSLPYGLAMDSSHFLWVAQHTLNKILVLDPRTGAFKEAAIPTGATNTQWITSDSNGNIWLAEQTGHALGEVTTIANPLTPAQASGNGGNNNNNQTNSSSGIYHLGFSYGQIAGPGVAAGVIATAFLYAKSVINLNQSVREVQNSVGGGGSSGKSSGSKGRKR
jgi:copper transport protein